MGYFNDLDLLIRQYHPDYLMVAFTCACGGDAIQVWQSARKDYPVRFYSAGIPRNYARWVARMLPEYKSLVGAQVPLAELGRAHPHTRAPPAANAHHLRVSVRRWEQSRIAADGACTPAACRRTVRWSR